jgi:4-hydroxy-tetrahydrodipicolinate synthase
MNMSTPSATSTFGTNLVAMCTPMNADGQVSRTGTDALLAHLLATGCDGVVVAGTTGEPPTLTPREQPI